MLMVALNWGLYERVDSRVVFVDVAQGDVMSYLMMSHAYWNPNAVLDYNTRCDSLLLCHYLGGILCPASREPSPCPCVACCFVFFFRVLGVQLPAPLTASMLHRWLGYPVPMRVGVN